MHVRKRIGLMALLVTVASVPGRVKVLAVFCLGFGMAILLDMAGLFYLPAVRRQIQPDVRRLADLRHELQSMGGDMSSPLVLYNSTSGLSGPPIETEVNGTLTKDNPPVGSSTGGASITAEQLYKDVRILCMVLTSPQTLDDRTIHIKQTWGKRCNDIVYISSRKNDSFPTIGTGVDEGRDNLTQKLLRGLRTTYDEHFMTGVFDWMFIADDDTYAILENMRYFLRDKDTDKPIYYGHHFRTIVPGGYFSGGGGIVVGREGLRRLFEKNSPECFKRNGDGGDWQLGMCLRGVDVIAGNSTDVSGNSRFHCFPAGTHVGKGYPDWYYAYDANGAKWGVDALSDYAITFHYVSGAQMHEMDYYVYHLVPIGVHQQQQALNQPKETNISHPTLLKP